MKVQKGLYQHYKGGFAWVVDTAKNSETLEEYVAYYHQGKESGKVELWVRPKAMFLEKVTINGKQLPRFKKVKQ